MSLNDHFKSVLAERGSPSPPAAQSIEQLLDEIHTADKRKQIASGKIKSDALPFQTLNILRNLPGGKAHLGGSRRMLEKAQEQNIPFKLDLTVADWDYYATYTHDIHMYLKVNDFEVSAKGDYDLDDEAAVIFKKGRVEIVLRQDADFYRSVFENIPVQLYIDHLWKSNPVPPDRKLIQPIFNMLFAVAHGVKGS